MTWLVMCRNGPQPHIPNQVPNQMSDINPELRYNAAKEDPYALKKKVVRGGSWKDVSQFIRSDMRSFEYQNETRSYIGFRCVRTQIGFSKSKGKK